jgi:hypothetical protein
LRRAIRGWVGKTIFYGPYVLGPGLPDVIFSKQISEFDKLWRDLQWKIWVYFMAIWSILELIWYMYFVAIWYILWPFGIFYGHLV